MTVRCINLVSCLSEKWIKHRSMGNTNFPYVQRNLWVTWGEDSYHRNQKTFWWEIGAEVSAFTVKSMFNCLQKTDSWSDVASIATMQQMDVPGLESRQEQEIFSSPELPDQLWRPHGLLFSGYSGSLLEGKRPKREGNPSPLSTEVRNEWSYTRTPHICQDGVDWVDFILLLKNKYKQATPNRTHKVHHLVAVYL